MKYGKVAVSVAVAALCVVSFARMPKNSYLVRPAKTKAELISQVKSESIVMDRYMRHYSMSRDEVVDYLSSLRLGRLQRSGVYGVFGVPRDGKIHVTNQSLRKGTLVWFDAAGQPAALEICGNPMNLGPRRMTMAGLVTPAVTQEPAPIVAMSTMTGDPVMAAPVIETSVPTTPLTPPAVEVAPTIVRNTGSLLPLIIPAALVAASIDRKGEPVPEPATMIALSAGVATLVARKRKARKN